MKSHLHETQRERASAEEPGSYLPPSLAELQRIERGGSLKKVHADSMPTPIRYFAYFFFISAVVMLISGIVIQFIK